MKNKKMAVVIAISLCLLIALLTVPLLATANDDNANNGLQISGAVDDVTSKKHSQDAYQTVKDMAVIPVTLEAWVYVPSTVSSDALGTLYGNYWTSSKYGMAYINWEIIENATPRLVWNSSLDGEKYDVTFSASQLPTDAWAHLAIVYDGGSGVVSCYVNGALTEEKYYYPEIDSDVLELPMMIGGDNRTLNTNYFKGGIGDITVYSDVRLESEIAADCTKGLEMTANTADLADAICYYDIDSDDIGKNIPDESGNGYDIIYSKTWLTEDEMAAIRSSYDFTPAYSFAVMGDTQMTADYYPEKMPTLYKWIADNASEDKKNIKFAIGLGDITNDNGRDDRYERVYVTEDEMDDGLCYLYDEEAAAYYYYSKVSSTSDSDAPYTQWDVAYDAIIQLDGKIPYSLIRGNHDVYPDYNGIRIEGFNTHFENSTWFTDQFTEDNDGGIYTYTLANGTVSTADLLTGHEVSYANTYQTLTVGTAKYLFLNLDWKITDDIIEWANGVVEAHSDCKVIVNTHAYLNGDGTTLDPGDPTPRSGYGGDVLWEKLVSKHENIMMVLSGHIDSETIVTNQVKGDNGNTVTEVLINPQGFDSQLGGTAMIAMFYFNENGDEILVEWYSPTKNMYYRNHNQFIIALDADAETRAQPSWDGVTVTKPSGSGTKDSPYKIENAENLAWISTSIKEGGVSFAGVYFEQTANIDLGTNVFTSIGSYCMSSSSMAAFGGIYDGCGYSITNGTITGGTLITSTKSPAPDRYFNYSEGYGLFGVIYGATIKNITLDNIQIVGRGVTGAIVGRAAAPALTDTELEGFNSIIGCEVKDTVKIVTLLPNTKYTAPASFDDGLRAGRVGSVCGMAYSTLISGCSSAVKFNLSGYFGLAGGIAGTAGLNSRIENCAFTGGMTLADNASEVTSYFGGIVGAVSPTASSADLIGNKLGISGKLYIGNCYNSGYFLYEGGDLSSDVYFGGIIGFAGDLLDVEDASAEYPFLIENCYNLYEKTRENSALKVAGIAAYATPGEKTLYVKNCYSVAIDVDDGENNEYRYAAGATSIDGLDAIVAENCATAAKSDMDAYVSAIDTEISSIKESGIQQTWVVGSGEPTADGTEGLKYLDTVGGIYYLYSDGAWSAVRNINITENSLETEYGTISKDYATNAIVLFLYSASDGTYSCVAGYDNLYDAVNGAINTKHKLPYDPNAKCVVYFRADIISDKGISGNLGYNVGTIIFDLGGHTLTQANANEPLFRGYSKYLAGAAEKYPDTYYLPAFYEIKNGNIVLDSHGLFYFGMDGSAYNNYTGPAPYEIKTLNWTLDGVNISVARGATLPCLIGEYNEHTDLKVQKSTHLNLTINDNCVIDITNAPSDFVLFDAYDPITEGIQSNGISYYTNSIVNVTVGACDIIAANDEFILQKINPENGSSVIYTADESGSYLTLTIDGTEYKHEDLYTPYGYIDTDYIDVSSHNIIEFRYLNGAYICYASYTSLATALSGDNGARKRCADEGSLSVVYLRDDYNVSSNMSGNFGYICGTMVIDLGGHTITQSNSGPLFKAYAKYDGSRIGNSTFKLINGSIALTNHSLFSVGLEGKPYANDITDVKTVNWTLDNINMTVGSGVANVFTEFFDYSSNLNDGRQMIFNLTVNDNCVIDITAASAGAVLFGANDTNIINTEGTSTCYTNSIVNINVGACAILAASGNDPVWYSINEDNGSSVTFAKNEEGKGAAVTVGDKSYSYESLCTPYGHTTLEYADFPISVFEYVDGAYVFNIGYATFDLISSVNALCLSSSEQKAVICLRDDIDTANYTSNSYVSGNFGWNVGTIIIDLNGHTLTQGANNTLLRAYAKYKSTTSITSGKFEIINGNIVLNSYGIFEVGAEGTPYSNATTTKTLYWTLDNVNISFKTGASAKNLIQFAEKLKVARPMIMDLTITDSCVIDLTNAPADFLLFNANETTSAYTDSIVNIHVEGVKILGGENSFVWYDVNESNNSSVTFGKSEDGNYMYLVLPKSAAESLDTSKVFSASDGTELVLYKIAEDDTNATYRLRPKAVSEISFTPKMSITLDRDLIMNVYVPSNCLVKFTFNNEEHTDLTALESALVEIDGAYYYRMQAPLPSAKALDSIKLIVTITVDEGTATGTFTFNIIKYAESVIKDGEAAEIALVKDTLSYVRAAYAYFGTDDAEAIAMIDALLGEGYDENNAPALNGSSDAPTEGLTGASLVLGATPGIRFYISGDEALYEFYTENGVKLDTVPGTDSTGDYIEIDAYAYVMCDTIYYSIDGTEAGSYHINSYYIFVTTDAAYMNNAKLISLVERFAKYCESAAAYRDYKIANS